MIEVTLGSETDDALFERLVAEVRAMGGSITDKEWQLGGSQEVVTFQITLPDGDLEAVCDTYAGLFLRGEPGKARELAERVVPGGLQPSQSRGIS